MEQHPRNCRQAGLCFHLAGLYPPSSFYHNLHGHHHHDGHHYHIIGGGDWPWRRQPHPRGKPSWRWVPSLFQSVSSFWPCQPFKPYKLIRNQTLSKFTYFTVFLAAIKINSRLMNNRTSWALAVQDVQDGEGETVQWRDKIKLKHLFNLFNRQLKLITSCINRLPRPRVV